MVVSLQVIGGLVVVIVAAVTLGVAWHRARRPLIARKGSRPDPAWRPSRLHMSYYRYDQRKAEDAFYRTRYQTPSGRTIVPPGKRPLRLVDPRTRAVEK